MRYFLVLSLTLIQILAFSGISCAAKRTALVIGNSAYTEAPLPNPVNDANDMAALLKRLGFDVIHEVNADHRTMLDALNRFSKKLQTSDVGIFFFAGHGMQIKEVNYLIPVNAALASEADINYECVHAKRVLDKMKEAGTRLNIVILDACRNNPLTKKIQSRYTSRDIARNHLPPGLAKMDAPPGSIIAYATSAGSIARDGRGRNGVFTAALLQNLKNPSFDVKEVINQTGLDVMKVTAGQQVPFTSSTPIPRYFLAGGEPSPSPDPVTIGSLRVTSQPSGAGILLNNSFRGKTPLDITSVSPGEYQVLATLDGYISQEKKIIVNKDRRAMVTFYLDAVETKARLYVTPKPADSLVRIMNIPDRYHSGMKLDPGRYDIEVSQAGYITKRQWVEIKGGNGIDLYVELEKEPDTAPRPGTGRQEWKEPVTGMEFVWIPGGEFMMGSNNGESIEKPVHKVGLDGFWMGKYEVTNGQYRQYKSSHDSKSYKGV